MTGSTAALVSFAESSALLHELAGVEVSVKQVERAAEALGTEIADDERSCVQPMGAVAPTMYLGMDGTGVPMRAAVVAGRTGKQSDGSAKTREAKLVAMWTAESRDQENKPVRDHLLGRDRKRGGLGYEPQPIPLCRAGTPRNDAPQFHRSGPLRSAGRWLCLDLEHRQGTVPSSHSDPRSVSRQRGAAPSRSIDLRRHQRRQAMGNGTLRGTG